LATPAWLEWKPSGSQKVYFLYLEVYFSYFLIGTDYKKIAAAYFEIEKIDKKVQKIYLEIGAACFLPVREGFFKDGLRIYYTVRHNTVVLLLVGGNKSTQVKDIEAAGRLLDELEE
jgi:putative addiction module killer protein